MNVSSLEIIKALGGVIAVGVLSLLGVVISASRSAKAARDVAKMNAQSARELKTADGEILLRAKIVDDRAGWEDRILKQMAATDARLDKVTEQLDAESRQRRELETKLHTAELHQSEMQKQIEVLQAEKRDMQKQISALNDENRRRQQRYEEELTDLHNELVTTKTERDELKTQLTALAIAKNIGGLEHLNAVSDDTNLRTKRIEKKVDAKPQIPPAE